MTDERIADVVVEALERWKKLLEPKLALAFHSALKEQVAEAARVYNVRLIVCDYLPSDKIYVIDLTRFSELDEDDYPIPMPTLDP